MKRPRVTELRWSDWLEVARILAVLALVEGWLRVGALPRLTRVLGVELQADPGPVGTPMQDALPEWAARRLVLTRGVVRRLYRGPACLRVSLVGGNRIRRLGPRLRIGVNTDDAGLTAHAWLEVAGQYFDPAAARYQPLATPLP